MIFLQHNYSAFLNCDEIDQSLVPDGWFENHFKWIVWKLASYEKHYPEHFANKLVYDLYFYLFEHELVFDKILIIICCYL